MLRPSRLYTQKGDVSIAATFGPSGRTSYRSVQIPSHCIRSIAGVDEAVRKLPIDTAAFFSIPSPTSSNYKISNALGTPASTRPRLEGTSSDSSVESVIPAAKKLVPELLASFARLPRGYVKRFDPRLSHPRGIAMQAGCHVAVVT